MARYIQLPTFDELPKFHDFTGCAWSVWGEKDELGTVNLVTEDVVREGSKEIKLGKSVSLNWPINFPEKPVFGRKTPHIISFARNPDGPSRDDEIHINTQSGTQWDSLKHFAIHKHRVFYNNTPMDSLPLGHLPYPDPLQVNPGIIKLGIHNLAQHGISTRGVLLDLVKFYTSGGTKPLPYDPWTTHAISVSDLLACAKEQGVEFRLGDVLLLRMGFMERYYSSSQGEKDALNGRPETFAGIEQSEDMKRFLWDNHFAAIASDQPALESWPPKEGTTHMHQTILGLFGMPIGEFFDLEGLSKLCEETGRYTFFFTSWPLHILGGCAAPPNAAAYF